MSNDEAIGLRARIAVVDAEIARHTADLKAATAEHWRHLRQHHLYDALRHKDELEARLALVETLGRKSK